MKKNLNKFWIFNPLSMDLINVKFHYLKIVTIVNIVLGILMLVSLGFFARSIAVVVHKKEEKRISFNPGEAKKYIKESLQEYEAMLKNNPFGISAVSVKRVSSGSDQAVLSDVKLMGTISGSNKRGYAVFTDKDGKQSMFATGESVFGVGTLKAVERYRVFVERNGKLVKVSMVDIVAPEEMEALKGRGGASGPVRLLGQGEYIVDQKAILYALDNPTQLMTDAKLLPNILLKDKREGFILQEVRKNGIYDNLGMRNGDVLLQINGFNISNPENALQAFTALRGMDKVQLDIIRGGNRMSINYQIR